MHITISIPGGLHKRARAYAKEQGASLSGLVCLLLSAVVAGKVRLALAKRKTGTDDVWEPVTDWEEDDFNPDAPEETL